MSTESSSSNETTVGTSSVVDDASTTATTLESITPLTPAEEAKKMGNDAFLVKNYIDAIKYYSEAIKYEPDVAIYYSNRSACYASLKDWKNAFDDAILCISKDSQFIKGYYRLASAQIELQQFDDAETTVVSALTIEPGNEVLNKLLKSVKMKRSAALKATKVVKTATPKKLDEATMKEAMELQEQWNSYNRDLRSVKIALNNTERESRLNAVTSNQIFPLDATIPLYRSVGKAFVLTSREKVESLLIKEKDDLEKAHKDLSDREEYLSRRMNSNMSNLKDLTGQ